MKETNLPSGRKLQITLSDFSTSRALYQVFLEEMKGMKVSRDEIVGAANTYKDFVCIALSSKKIESALNDCLKKVAIDGLKIDDQTFEAEEHRGDYLPSMIEVVSVNIMPFMKSLYAQYAPFLAGLMKNENPA